MVTLTIDAIVAEAVRRSGDVRQWFARSAEDATNLPKPLTLRLLARRYTNRANNWES